MPIPPIIFSHKFEIDYTAELKAAENQCFQEIVGSLCFAIELSKIDILQEISLQLSMHLVVPCKGHLKQVLHVVEYLKPHKKLRLMFDLGYPKVKES